MAIKTIKKLLPILLVGFVIFFSGIQNTYADTYWLTGELTKTGTTYYIKYDTGEFSNRATYENINIGTSPDLRPDREVGKDYKCYRESANSTTITYCTKITTPVCGNGTKESGEECDLGARQNGSCPKTCSSTCKTNSCSVDTPEETPTEEAAATPPEEVGIGFKEVVSIDKIFESSCASGETVHSSGILKGISCTGATKTKEDLVKIINNLIEQFLRPIAGVLFITMIVVGGIVYITSGGNEERIKLGKKILTTSIIGLLLVTLSLTLIKIFVNLLGGSVT